MCWERFKSSGSQCEYLLLLCSEVTHWLPELLAGWSALQHWALILQRLNSVKLHTQVNLLQDQGIKNNKYYSKPRSPECKLCVSTTESPFFPSRITTFNLKESDVLLLSILREFCKHFPPPQIRSHSICVDNTEQ